MVISGLLGLELLIASAFAVWPPVGSVWVTNTVIAALLLLATVGCAVRPRARGPLILVEAWLVVTWVMVLVVIATRPIESSQLLWAALLILVGIAAAFYLPMVRAAYQVAGMVVGYAIAALAFQPPTRPLFVAGFAVLVVGCAFAVAVLRRDRDRVVRALEAMATTDALTGLVNRRGLEIEAGIVHANAVRAGGNTVVAVLDLDGLKRVNDSLGHVAGDEFITEAVRHWQTALRDGDVIARVGGDEFVVVLPQADESSAADLLTRIRNHSVRSWSHGWTVWTAYESLDEAIERADALMYAEKVDRKAGRGAATGG